MTAYNTTKVTNNYAYSKPQPPTPPPPQKKKNLHYNPPHFTIQTGISFKSPLILPTYVLLFLRSKVIPDVEGVPDLFRGLSLDHVRNGLAHQVQQVLDVQVVCSLMNKLRERMYEIKGIIKSYPKIKYLVCTKIEALTFNKSTQNGVS